MTLRLYVKRVCALLLDLDDTLLDGSSFPQTVTRTCEELASLRTGLEARQLQEANHTVFATYGPERLDAWTLGRLSGAELAVEAWRRTLQACGNHDDALAQFAAKTHLRFAWESYQPFPDVAGLMSAVRQAHVPIALVTNGAADTQRIKIEALGIASNGLVLFPSQVRPAWPNRTIVRLLLCSRLLVYPASMCGTWEIAWRLTLRARMRQVLPRCG